MPSLTAHNPDLLDVLHAMVSADQGAPGFAGRIAVALKTKPVRWWVVDLAATASGQFVDALPDDVDACLGFGLAEADAVLGRAPMPEQPDVVTSGDQQLIDKFFARYVRKLSMVGLRAGQ